MQASQLTIEEKQIFLRNQILEGGLDPQCFMDYMGTVKKQGQNIQLDNWTMQELNQVVRDFKTQIKADSDTLQEVKKSQIRESQEMLSKIIRSVIKKQKVHYEKGIWDYQIKNQQECRTYPRSFVFNPKIKPRAQIPSHQVRTHGGFFFGIGSTTQLWLKIQTNFTQKPVQRTNTEVEWLREALIKYHPGCYVPPLPQLRAVQPQDKKGLTQRAKLIEQFLNGIIQYEYLIQSPISGVFFKQPDHTKLTNFKSKQRNSGYQKSVSRIQTLEGKFQLEISQRSQKFIKNCSSFGRVAQQTYVQIQQQVNKVLLDLQTLSKHIFYIANSCGTLHQKYIKICGLNDIKDNNMQTVMMYLNNMLSNIGTNLKSQMDVIKSFSDDYIQSTVRNWEQFLLHDRRYQKQLQSYLCFKSQLVKKKERYFNDITKWQLESEKQIQKISRMNTSVMEKDEVFSFMFPRDNKTQEQTRIWIAYLNRVYEQSFKTLLKSEQNLIKQKFLVFVQHAEKLSKEEQSTEPQAEKLLAGLKLIQ